METTVSSIESLFESAKSYATTTIELSKLKLLKTTTLVSTSLIAKLSVIILILLFAFVASIGIALLLSDLLGKSYWGFFIVAGFYLIVAIVAHFFLECWIKKPISDFIINQALHQDMSCEK